MPVTENRVALNVIQWMFAPTNPRPLSYADPDFIPEYGRILGDVRRAGFRNVAMKVLPTQTLQSYRRLLEQSSLGAAPGYVQVILPEDAGKTLDRRSDEYFRWLDDVRRRAEETLFCGLDSVFLAADIPPAGSGRVRVDRAVAVGASKDADRLARITELLGDAAEVLRREGVRAGLHNHVGSWVETEDEIDYVLANTDPGSLSASFDIGHLAWAGVDPATALRRHADRLLDLHVKDLDLTVAAKTRLEPTSYADATDSGLFFELGLGDIDYAAVIDALPMMFDGWVVVEVDKPSMEPFASAVQSRTWVVDNLLGGQETTEGDAA